jgi:MoaA/NifB/PqqE/SkfB family radical SAM enzyme
MKHLINFKLFESEKEINNFLFYSNKIMDLINSSSNYQNFLKKIIKNGLETEISESDYNEMKSFVTESNNDYEEGEEKILSRSYDTDIFKTNVKVDNNINLYIDLCRKCSGNCKFCIAKLKKDYLKKVKNPKEFLDKLDSALAKLKEINPSVMIVGGEPTVDREKLLGTMDLIKKHGLRKPILVSNGSHLEEYINYINDKDVFEHINISRHHYDDTTNEKVFNSKKVPNTEKLSKIINKIKNKNIIRFNTMIVKEGLNSYDDVIKFINYSNNLGIKNISFSELSELEGVNYFSKGIEQYTKENLILIDEIINQVNENDNFELFKTVKGPYYQAYIYNYKPYNIVIVFKKTDMKKMNDFEIQNKNVIAELVFNTDTSLSGSWVPTLKSLELK